MITRGQMFDWLEDNKVSIFYHSSTKWTKQDGSVFYSDFVMSAGGIQFAPAETLEEAIEQAMKIIP